MVFRSSRWGRLRDDLMQVVQTLQVARTRLLNRAQLAL
jgi:hypothetical protein